MYIDREADDNNMILCGMIVFVGLFGSFDNKCVNCCSNSVKLVFKYGVSSVISQFILINLVLTMEL